MPADAFEETLELDIELLEAELPLSASDPSYPYPRLSMAGAVEPRTFRALVLENALLRAVVLPDLGGRLWSLVDKRTGAAVLPDVSRPKMTAGGPRGVTLPVGIVASSRALEGLTSLGGTLWALEPEGPEGSASVWIGDACEGTGLSRQIRYTLEGEAPELGIEQRTFNRAYQDVPYNGSLVFYLGPGEAKRLGPEITYFSAALGAGLWIDAGETVLDGVGFSGDCLTLARFAEPRMLAARQLDTLSVRVVAFSGLRSLEGASGEAAISLSEEGLQIQASRTRPGHKLVLLAGETLETTVDLYAEQVLALPASDLPSGVVEVAVLSPAKEEIVRTGRPWGALEARGYSAVLSPSEPHAQSHEDLLRATFDVGRRHAAYALLAREAIGRRELARAEAYLEQALLYNGEDALSWWAKAVCARLREGPGDESPELLNAHFLAPLEPALRAEAFLSQDQQMGKEPNPLLAAFEEAPETFVEVAALLTDLGLNDQATRWIDESLRHVDLAMLRYLQAFCYLRGSRMHVEAAECVAAASRLGFTPPLPWRAIEWEALAELQGRFPRDEVLARYLGLRAV